MDLKGSGVSNKKKEIEEYESNVPSRNNNSEGEENSVKVAFCNEEKSDSYKGLSKVDGVGEGSEVSITENTNDNTSLYACKGPPKLEWGETRLLKSVWQVRILSVKPRMIVQQR